MKQTGIFIGLGGTGMQTVARIKALLRGAYKTKDEMYNANHFIFMDTDSKTLKKINENSSLRQSLKGNKVIESHEFFNFGETNPYASYRVAKNRNDCKKSKRFLEWTIDQDKSGNFQFRNVQLQVGAGAERMTGRTAVYNNWDPIKNKIQSGINKMVKIKPEGQSEEIFLKESKPLIWVFSSANGGTGSSALLDTLYIADRLFQKAFQGDPFIRLVLYMPQPFIDRNSNSAQKDYYYLNAYSTLWELNAFRYDSTNDSDGKKFKYFSCVPDTDVDGANNCPNWNLYTYLMPIDIETKENRKLASLEELFENTAQMCFYLHKSAAGDAAVSALDNDLRQTKLFQTDSNNDFNWSKSLVAGGYRAIRKPNNELKDYITLRLRYDIFNYGLLGPKFNDIHESEEKKDAAKKDFADRYVLKYLMDVEGFESDQTSFANICKQRRDQIRVLPPYDIKKGLKKDEWAGIWKSFENKTNGLENQINNEYNNTSGYLSKTAILDLIKNSVLSGTNDIIMKYGLNYAMEMIYLVDDKYCENIESYLEQKKPKNEELLELEKEAKDIINKKNNKQLEELKSKLEKYRDKLIEKLIFEKVKEVLVDLTNSETGFLEILRGGKGNIEGIKGLIININNYKENAKIAYERLSKTFYESRNAIFVKYIPDISQFCNKQNAKWENNHFFESLYSDIIELDNSPKAITVGDESLGLPPVRCNGRTNKDMDLILKGLTNNLNTNYFVEKCINEVYTSNIDIEKLEKEIESFTNQKFKEGKVKEWLDRSLKDVFNEEYKDNIKRIDFVDAFRETIPILYPQQRGTEQVSSIRILFAGQDKDFAEKLGYDSSNSEQQFAKEENLKNDFIIIKLETGQSFANYKGFNSIRDYYFDRRREIKNYEYGCHIHKDFALLDLQKAISGKEEDILKDFFKIALYDSYFENLYNKNKDLYNTLFNNLDDTILGDDMWGDNNGGGQNTYKSLLKVETNNNQDFSIDLAVLNNKDGKITVDDNNSNKVELKRLKSLTDFRSQLESKELKFNNIVSEIKNCNISVHTRQDLNRFLTDNKDNIKRIFTDKVKSITKLYSQYEKGDIKAREVITDLVKNFSI
jgi:hypothetical protein